MVSNDPIFISPGVGDHFGDSILDPTGFAVGRCLICGELTWAAFGSLCQRSTTKVDMAGGGVMSKAHQLPCGGPLELEDAEVQEAFRCAHRTGGWPAIYAMVAR